MTHCWKKKKQISMLINNILYKGEVVVNLKGTPLPSVFSAYNSDRVFNYPVEAFAYFGENRSRVYVKITNDLQEVPEITEQAEKAIRDSLQEYVDNMSIEGSVKNKLKSQGYDEFMEESIETIRSSDIE